MMRVDSIYWIGGSPCSGKSTLAEALTERYGMTYYKQDDHLEELIRAAAQAGGRRCADYLSLTPEQVWMRAPEVQCDAEIGIYWEMFGYAAAKLESLPDDRPIITEGAGWLPELMHGYGVRRDRYLCVVPEREFQFTRYRERPWIGAVLEGCADKQAAFANWMERDALFARCAEGTAEALGYAVAVTGTDSTPEALFELAVRHFGLT